MVPPLLMLRDSRFSSSNAKRRSAPAGPVVPKNEKHCFQRANNRARPKHRMDSAMGAVGVARACSGGAYFRGLSFSCPNSPCNQPLAVSDSKGSGWSQSRHRKTRRPPPGGNANTIGLLQTGQGLIAPLWPMAKSLFLRNRNVHHYARVIRKHSRAPMKTAPAGGHPRGAVRGQLSWRDWVA